MAEDKVYLLTQEAYNKMKEELAHREGELREEIAHKIAVARAEGICPRMAVIRPPARRRARTKAVSPSSPSSCATPRLSKTLPRVPWATVPW